MITLNVNGQNYQVDVHHDTPLLWVLRDLLFLTGTKYGCGISVCWACAIIVNGEAEKSCDYSVGEAEGKTITTIEGLDRLSPNPDSPINRLQQSWIEHQAPQCGYCQSGMLMKAAAMFLELEGEDNPTPSDSNINDKMKNICVCGTYQRVRAAIKGAANS